MSGNDLGTPGTREYSENLMKLMQSDPQKAMTLIQEMKNKRPGNNSQDKKLQDALDGAKDAEKSANEQKAKRIEAQKDFKEAGDAYLSIKSPEGQKILADFVKLRATNPSEASDIETKAIISKATRDWHKLNPKEKRDPSQVEIYKPVMMMSANPQLHDLAIVEYEPERLRIVKANEQAKAQEQAKSKTPNFDKLSPEEKLAVEWSVRKEYDAAHVYRYSASENFIGSKGLGAEGLSKGGDFFSKLAVLHGVSAKQLEAEFKAEKRKLFPATSSDIVDGRVVAVDLPREEVDKFHRISERGPLIKGTAEFIVNQAAENVANNLKYNSSAVEKWRTERLNQIAGDPTLFKMAVERFAVGNKYESNVKAEKPVERRNKEYSTVLTNRIEATDNELESIFKREGCEWTHGDYTEVNPSTACKPSSIPANVNSKSTAVR